MKKHNLWVDISNIFMIIGIFMLLCGSFSDNYSLIGISLAIMTIPCIIGLFELIIAVISYLRENKQ